MKSPNIREVVVDRKVYDRFKRRAFLAYPKEMAEQLWGTVDKGQVFVHVIEPVELTYQSKDGVDFDFEQPCGTKSGGTKADRDLILLGSIHTHPAPYDIAAPSDNDIRAAVDDGEIVWGICAIRKTDKRRFASCRFWSTENGEVEFVVAE